MLSNLDVYYEKASVEVKRKIIGLITPGKMVFSENGVQTIGDTKAVALLSRFCRDVEMAKRKQTAENRCLSCLVTSEEHCSNQNLSFFKQLFDLHSCIRVIPLSPSFLKDFTEIYPDLKLNPPKSFPLQDFELSISASDSQSSENRLEVFFNGKPPNSEPKAVSFSETTLPIDLNKDSKN
ncbi:MAG: hypothetical protein AABZ60_20800 [Planctomycetota bacterium]